MDPLFASGLSWSVLAVVVIKTVVTFGFLLIATMLMVWFERKVIGDMQNRIGPNRAGPWGILQTLADGIKLFFKEDLLPDRADRRIFRLAPFLSFVPAFITFAVIPIGGVFRGTPNAGDANGTISLLGHDTFLQLADPPIGILVVLAMSSIAVYGVMLAGWSSGSKYPLLGSVRASAQMVSYEAALGLSVVTVVLVNGSLSTHQIVAQQARGLAHWTVIAAGVVPFIIFLIAGTAEIERPPFDLLEAEQELVAGFNTEYSSIRFALFYLASFMSTITMSAIIVTLFLGGPSGPAPIGPEWIWGLIWFFGKLVVFLFTFVWFRGTLPRFRYDQLMDLGWKLMIPLSLGWLLVIAAIRIASNREVASGTMVLIVLGCAVGLLVGASLLSAAMRVARARRLAGEVEY